REVFGKALEARREYGPDRAYRVALWTVARNLRSLGQLEAALAMQFNLNEDNEKRGEKDGFVYEELGELLHALGRDEEARPWFAKAHTLLSQKAWLVKDHPERMKRMEELAG